MFEEALLTDEEMDDLWEQWYKAPYTEGDDCGNASLDGGFGVWVRNWQALKTWNAIILWLDGLCRDESHWKERPQRWFCMQCRMQLRQAVGANPRGMGT